MASLKLTVNGEPTEAPAGATVRALLEQLALGSGPVAVEVNRTIVTRADHATHALKDGDVIEIVHLVGGG
jgi:sulfur carrier protein